MGTYWTPDQIAWEDDDRVAEHMAMAEASAAAFDAQVAHVNREAFLSWCYDYEIDPEREDAQELYDDHLVDEAERYAEEHIERGSWGYRW